VRASAQQKRRSASLAMIAIASVATLATSESRPSIGNVAEGPVQVLDPDHPRSVSPFEFRVNDAALTEDGSVWVRVEHEAFWSGFDPGPTTPELGFSLVKTDDLKPAEHELEDGSCIAAIECVGTYQVSFSWPEEVQKGSVRVQWRVEGFVHYEEISEPPEGAWAKLTIEDQSTSAPIRVFTQLAGVGIGPATYPVVRDDVRIELAAPLDGGTIGFEVSAAIDPAPTVILLEPRRIPITVSHSTSVPLHPPERCRAGPCSFGFSVVVATTPNQYQSSIEWGVVIPDARAGAEDVEIVVRRASVPSRLATISLGEMGLSADKHVDISILIDIPPGALPTDEFGLVPAPVLIRIDLQITGRDPDIYDEVTTLVRFPGERGRLAWQGDSSSEPDGQRPVFALVPTPCEHDAPCMIRALVSFDTAERDERMFVRIDPLLSVSVAYPITKTVPNRPTISVTSEAG
jgi:hypothetical protein